MLLKTQIFEEEHQINTMNGDGYKQINYFYVGQCDHASVRRQSTSWV